MTSSMFSGLKKKLPPPAKRMKVFPSFSFSMISSLLMLWQCFLYDSCLFFVTKSVGFPLREAVSLWFLRVGFPGRGSPFSVDKVMKLPSGFGFPNPKEETCNFLFYMI